MAIRTTQRPLIGFVEFWERLQRNDLKGSMESLKQNNELLNTFGPNGITPIQFAIKHGRVEIVGELLKLDHLRIDDALLHAVKNGDKTIVHMVMDDMAKRGLSTDGPFENTIHFNFYMTPLMLACLVENYVLVEYLIKKGHRLILPHGSKCACPDCVKDHPDGEKLEIKLRRIDSYAAACSLPFVLQQDDPFDYIMSLTRFLNDCKKYEPTFSTKYNEIIDKLNDVMILFVSGCDKHEKIETILHQCPKDVPPNECVFGYPRVDQAIRSSQKQFLAQPNCQSVIYAGYSGQWSDRFRWNRAKRVACFLLHTILFPLASLVCIFTCNNWPPSFKNPISRALTSFSSYVLFLSALIFYTQYKEARSHLGSPTLGSKDAALYFLFAYIAGMWVRFITDLRRFGATGIFAVWWRKFDFLFLFIWTCTILAFIDAVIRAENHRMFDLHRVHWSPDEPQLIFEIFFTWAAILSSVRLLYYGQLLDHFGVVTVSILRCIPTILRYVVVLFVVLAAFAIGLNHMYEHYKDNVVTRGDRQFFQPFQLTRDLSSLFTTARYLYWAYYGYLPPETWSVVVGEVAHGTERTEKSHSIITYAGEFMSGLYHVIELIILLNLMVAIMTAAAVSVIDKESIEWKFVRVAIWTEYFQDSRIIPPPFNLLQLLIHGVVYLFRKIIIRNKPLSAWDCSYKHPTEDKNYSINEQAYATLVVNLKRRLLASKIG